MLSDFSPRIFFGYRILYTSLGLYVCLWGVAWETTRHQPRKKLYSVCEQLGASTSFSKVVTLTGDASDLK